MNLLRMQLSLLFFLQLRRAHAKFRSRQPWWIHERFNCPKNREQTARKGQMLELKNSSRHPHPNCAKAKVQTAAWLAPRATTAIALVVALVIALVEAFALNRTRRALEFSSFLVFIFRASIGLAQPIPRSHLATEQTLKIPSCKSMP